MNTKTILIWGGIALGAYLVYTKVIKKPATEAGVSNAAGDKFYKCNCHPSRCCEPSCANIGGTYDAGNNGCWASRNPFTPKNPAFAATA